MLGRARDKKPPQKPFIKQSFSGNPGAFFNASSCGKPTVMRTV
jgi:hypothetical protein